MNNKEFETQLLAAATATCELFNLEGAQLFRDKSKSLGMSKTWNRSISEAKEVLKVAKDSSLNYEDCASRGKLLTYIRYIGAAWALLKLHGLKETVGQTLFERSKEAAKYCPELQAKEYKEWCATIQYSLGLLGNIKDAQPASTADLMSLKEAFNG